MGYIVILNARKAAKFLFSMLNESQATLGTRFLF